jgi:hypothetical protein
VNLNQATSIRNEVSYFQGVNPDRNYFDATDSTMYVQLPVNDASPTSTKFIFTLLSSRMAAAPTTSSLQELSDTTTFDYSTNMQTDLTTIVGVSFSAYQKEDDQTRSAPTWANSPDLSDTNENDIQIKMKSSRTGEQACIAVEGKESDFTLVSE